MTVHKCWLCRRIDTLTTEVMLYGIWIVKCLDTENCREAVVDEVRRRLLDVVKA